VADIQHQNAAVVNKFVYVAPPSVYTNSAPNVSGDFVMAKTKKAPRKRKSEYAPPRPVLSVRIDEFAFEDISREAAARNTTVTDEVYRRLLFYQARKLKHAQLAAREKAVQTEEEVQQAEVERFEAALERRGYRRISGSSGTAWAEPGAKNISIPSNSVLHPDLEAAIVAAIERGIAKALKDRKE
jgi:hypothetical protein